MARRLRGRGEWGHLQHEKDTKAGPRLAQSQRVPRKDAVFLTEKDTSSKLGSAGGGKEYGFSVPQRLSSLVGHHQFNSFRQLGALKQSFTHQQIPPWREQRSRGKPCFRTSDMVASITKSLPGGASILAGETENKYTNVHMISNIGVGCQIG